MRSFVFAVFLLGCASAQSASPVTADTVIAAERAFAARAGVVGWAPAFREYAAADADIATPDGYTNAQTSLAETPDDGNRNLFWWPAFGGIARSGDFGFTTGDVSFDEARTPRGHYFTVWRRQPDGSWKWIYDGGVGPIAGGLIASDEPRPPTIEIATGGMPAAEASAAVLALERAGQRTFAIDAQSFRTRAERTLGGPGPTPAEIAYEISRTEVSVAGDMVVVLGLAHWPRNGGSAQGLFARVWQLRADGWRVVYDQLVLPRPSPPPG